MTSTETMARAAEHALNPAALQAEMLRTKALTVLDVASGAGVLTIPCPDRACDRRFFSDKMFLEHADKVHTFSDIQMMVGNELREKFGRRGDYNATPVIPSIWVWVEDLTDDWVVYQVDGGDNEGLYQVTYTIDDDSETVSFGVPAEVVRRTVYDVVGS